MSNITPVAPDFKNGIATKKKEEIPPSELWLALTAIPRPHRIVPFPRNIPGTNEPIGHIAVWPLTQEEQMAANGEADRFTKALMKDPQKREEANLGYHHTFTNDLAVQILWRACRDPQDLKRPIFPAPNLMRKELSTDEVGVLFASYLTVQAEVGPIVAHMSEAEIEAFILRLKEGGSAFPFDSLSWEQQRVLVSSMASRLVSCWTAMSYAGLPLDVASETAEVVKALVEASPPAQESVSEEEPEEEGETPEDVPEGTEDGETE